MLNSTYCGTFLNKRHQRKKELEGVPTDKVTQTLRIVIEKPQSQLKSFKTGKGGQR